MLLCIGAVCASANTFTTASCSQSAVQTAINSASDGDTVRIPPCSATTWTSGVSVNNKAVAIEGAGVDLTTIALSGGTSLVSFSGSSAGNSVATLGNLTVTGSGGDSFIHVASQYRFRLHHLKIGDVSNRAIAIVGPYGLIDHCQFTTTNGYNAIQVLGGQYTPTGRWSEAMAWGSANAVYIEDSTFTATNCVTGLGVFDGFNGSKIVFRHNTVTNWQSYVHGYDTASESALQTEVYDNLFDMAKSSCAIDRMIFIRGGTGYFFNNTMHLTDSDNLYNPSFVSLYYYRDTQAEQGTKCDGSAAVDENRPGMNGYLCHQQPGEGGPAPHTSVPIYEYNNVGTANMPTNLSIRNESTHVAEGRDYFSGTPRPGYAAYLYPHPLQSGNTAPAPPTNFSAAPH